MKKLCETIDEDGRTDLMLNDRLRVGDIGAMIL